MVRVICTTQRLQFFNLHIVMIPELAAQVETVFDELDREIALFQAGSTLHCKMGCGKCCFKPDIEATVLEFVPFALFLYREGKAFEWLDRLRETKDSLCLILNPTQAGAGLCSEYRHRGLICRLFGYSARTNKYDRKELVTCEIIKTEQAEAYDTAAKKIEAGGAVPVMNQFYMRLHAIDADLTRDFYPINEAIKKAVELVLQYYRYRE